MRGFVYRDNMSIRAQYGGAQWTHGMSLDMKHGHLAGFTRHVEPAQSSIKRQYVGIFRNIEACQHAPAAEVQHDQLVVVFAGMKARWV